MAGPAPLHQRIELAEAYIELVWTNIKLLPPSRGGIIADSRVAKVREAEMAKIDWMLDKLALMYLERDVQALESA